MKLPFDQYIQDLCLFCAALEVAQVIGVENDKRFELLRLELRHHGGNVPRIQINSVLHVLLVVGVGKTDVRSIENDIAVSRLEERFEGIELLLLLKGRFYSERQ